MQRLGSSQSMSKAFIAPCLPRLHCTWQQKLIASPRSDSVRHVLRVGPRDESPNLLLVAGKEVALVNGKSLQPLWRFNTSSVIR